MLEKVLTSARKHHLISPGDHVLVAVSGGADSTALLYALHELAPELKIRLGIAHLNHRLRGAESNGDERFVEKLAARTNLPFIRGTGNVLRLAGERGISVEMAAREVRYKFFASAAKKAGAGTVATAHTADDQAETVLLKLARGSASGGLAGIPRETFINQLRVIRPLLNATRGEVIEFLEERGLEWREDSTNADTKFLRNRIRHQVIPMLEKEVNPRISEALNRTAEIFQSENRWLEEMIAKRIAECTDNDGGLVVTMVRNQPVAARRRIIRAWLAEAGVPHEKVDFETIERIDTILETAVRSTNITGGMTVRKRYGKLSLLPSSDTAAKPFRVALNIPGETVLAEEGLRVVIDKGPGLVKDKVRRAGILPATASVSSPAAGRKRFYLRSWRKGDRMRPLGLGGSRKLQDIFVDEKVPHELRGQVPIFECGKEIIWIPGYRVAEGWEVKDKAEQALQIYIERI